MEDMTLNRADRDVRGNSETASFCFPQLQGRMMSSLASGRGSTVNLSSSFPAHFVEIMHGIEQVVAVALRGDEQCQESESQVEEFRRV